MSNFFEKFADITSTIAEKVDGNKYLSTIKNTFTFFLPFVMVGSFSTLGKQYISNTTTGLAKFDSLSFLQELAPAFSAINFATIGMITIYIVFVFGYLLSQRNGEKPIYGGIVALASYVSVSPESITVTIDEVSKTTSCLPTATIDCTGLFFGMLLTIVVIEFYCRLCKSEKLKIKLPETVPTAIANTFNRLIPVTIALFTVAILGRLFVVFTSSYLNDYIYAIFQKPVESFFQSTGGIIFVTIFMQFFWFCGIHGGLIISPVRNPILIAGLAENIAMYESGLTPTNAVTYSSWRCFMTLGGAGLVISLVLDLILFSKRAESKEIAKVGLVPAICGISEPVVFGLPLVFNFVYFIPYILGSGLATAIYMFAVHIGFVIPPAYDVPSRIPVLLNGWLGYGWHGVILQIIIILATMLLYLPFVLIDNKKFQKEQQSNAGIAENQNE